MQALAKVKVMAVAKWGSWPVRSLSLELLYERTGLSLSLWGLRLSKDRRHCIPSVAIVKPRSTQLSLNQSSYFKSIHIVVWFFFQGKIFLITPDRTPMTEKKWSFSSSIIARWTTGFKEVACRNMGMCLEVGATSSKSLSQRLSLLTDIQEKPRPHELLLPYPPKWCTIGRFNVCISSVGNYSC